MFQFGFFVILVIFMKFNVSLNKCIFIINERFYIKRFKPQIGLIHRRKTKSYEKAPNNILIRMR